MKNRRSRRKLEISFSFAVGAAVVLHVVAGLILKYNVVAAIPIVSNRPAPPPVTLRFVEVPPNTPVSPVPPNTNHYSDASHLASPPAGKTQAVAGGGGRSRPSPAMAKPTPSSEPSVPAEQPEDQQVALQPDTADEGIRVGPGKTEALSSSLKNLDKYIGSGGGTGGGTGNGQPQPGSGAGVLFDTKGHDLGPWGNEVVAIVRSNWIIPVAAQLGLRGVVGISFQVDRQGNIGGLSIVSQSGVPSFDQAALNALKSSSPLPPLPVDYPEPILSAVFRFYYNTPVPNE